MTAGVPDEWKPTILTELGRIQDEDEMKDMAEYICQHKYKTKKAVDVIRAFRRGGWREPDLHSLSSVIVRAINGYTDTCLDTDPDLIRDALSDVYERLS